MKFLVALFCAIALASVTVANPTRYDGYKVYRVTFYTDEQFNILYQMDVNSNPADGVMFWQLSHAQHYADIMIAPEKIDSFLASLKSFGFTYKLIIENVQDSIHYD